MRCSFSILVLLPACTAVVTEISYREGTSIVADVSFISAEEIEAELDVLKYDIQATRESDKPISRPINMESAAGIAWQKVRICDM